MNVLAISGSLRKDSLNTAMARAIQKLAPAGMTIDLADISQIPLFNQDLEAAYPVEAKAFKDRVRTADGIIFVTPEHNRSIPAALKNAIDWASRPYGTNAFEGKPVLIAGVTGGRIGTALAQSHLKQIMLYLDAQVIGQPELYLGVASELFDTAGTLVNEPAKELLTKGLQVLANRIA